MQVHSHKPGNHVHRSAPYLDVYGCLYPGFCSHCSLTPMLRITNSYLLSYPGRGDDTAHHVLQCRENCSVPHPTPASDLGKGSSARLYLHASRLDRKLPSPIVSTPLPKPRPQSSNIPLEELSKIPQVLINSGLLRTLRSVSDIPGRTQKLFP